MGRKQTKIYSINNVPLKKKLVFIIYLIILNKKRKEHIQSHRRELDDIDYVYATTTTRNYQHPIARSKMA